jgi:hypothetical protein
MYLCTGFFMFTLLAANISCVIDDAKLIFCMLVEFGWASCLQAVRCRSVRAYVNRERENI